MVNFPISNSLLSYDDLDPNILFPPVDDNERDFYIFSPSQEVFQQISSLEGNPTLHGRVTELSSRKKRKEINGNEKEAEKTVSRKKKQRIDSRDQAQVAITKEDRQAIRREKNKLSARRLRQRQKEEISDLEQKVEELIKKAVELRFNDSLTSLPPVTERETLVSKKGPPQKEEFLETHKDLSEEKQRKEFRRAQNRYSAALSRARKKDYIDTLQQRKQFLESKIANIARNLF